MTENKQPQKLDAPVRHLLVDLDGTLLGNRSLTLSFDFASKALSTLKVYGGWRKTARTLLTINNLFQRSSRRLTNDLRVVNLFSRQMKLEPEQGRKALKDALQRVFPSLQKHFYPIPGAKDFLDWAKDRYPMTLATNPVWPPEIINLRVQWAGIDPALFQFVTHVKAMHACKPAPEYYREILALQKLQPEDCLLIGNDVKMDLPATQVGIRVFIVGPFKKLSSLKHPNGTVTGWKGSYKHLRELLESADGVQVASSSDQR